MNFSLPLWWLVLSNYGFAEETPPVEGELPWIFLCVFGIPLFFTLIYLMLQLSRPDRGGRIDLDALPMPDEEPSEDQATDPETSDTSTEP